MSILVSILLFSSSLQPAEVPHREVPQRASFQREGQASYYASRFYGRRTSSGERVQGHILTAAHRYLPFNTLVEVTNKTTQQSVVVRINDRGPFHKGRVIDLTHAGAKAIGMLGRGLANVSLRVVGKNRLMAAMESDFTPITSLPALPLR